MSEWMDTTSEAVSGSQSPIGTDIDELEIEGPDPDDDCIGGDDAVDRGPEQFEFYD